MIRRHTLTPPPPLPPKSILCFKEEPIMGKAMETANHAFIAKIRAAGITAEDIINFFENLQEAGKLWREHREKYETLKTETP